MTTVTYNGIVLQNVLVREFRQEVVYDPSRTDPLFSRYTIAVEGLISGVPTAPGFVPKEQPGREFHPIWRRVRQALLEPRHTLEITQTFWAEQKPGQKPVEKRVTVFRVTPCEAIRQWVSDPDRDLDNGPKPISLQTLGIYGTNAVRVLWTVECSKIEGPQNALEASHFDKAGNPPWIVLTNRWSVDELLDQNFAIIRTIQGYLRLSTPLALLVDDYRFLCIPNLEPGFRREQIRYSVNPSGLEANYVVVDRQIHTAAPYPATDMNVQHERILEAAGTTVLSRVSIALEGPPTVSRAWILLRAIQIADVLLGILSHLDDFVDGRRILRNLSVTEDIGPRNSVRLTAEIQHLGQIRSGYIADWISEALNEMGRDLFLPEDRYPTPRAESPPSAEAVPYQAVYSWDPWPWGHRADGGRRSPAELAVLQCYLQRPYRDPHAVGANREALGMPEPIQEIPPPRIVRHQPGQLPIPRPRPSPITREAAENVYTFARMETTYSIDYGRAAVPLTAQAADGRTAASVLIHQPLVRRRTVIDVERVGAEPQLPQPTDYSESEVNAHLAYHRVTRLPPCVAADGVRLVYRTRAVYEWHIDRPLPQDRPWPVGHLPHLQDNDPGFRPTVAYSPRVGPGN